MTLTATQVIRNGAVRETIYHLLLAVCSTIYSKILLILQCT